MEDVECRHGQSTILSRIWQQLNKLRIPSLLHTKEAIKEKKMPKILSLEKGSLTNHMTTTFIVKEELNNLLRSNEGIAKAQV